jgi:hypothetical protein
MGDMYFRFTEMSRGYFEIQKEGGPFTVTAQGFCESLPLSGRVDPGLDYCAPHHTAARVICRPLIFKRLFWSTCRRSRPVDAAFSCGSSSFATIYGEVAAHSFLAEPVRGGGD